MSAELEIIIPTRNPGAQLFQTVESLLAQSDKQFRVLLSDNLSSAGVNHLDAAQRRFNAAHIEVRRIKPPCELTRLEHLNWTHTQTQAIWLKLLLPGEQLKSACVARLKDRIAARPEAHLIRFDAGLRTDWGVETLTAPFSASHVNATEFTNFFPAHVDWLSRSLNFACTRSAWLAVGGYGTYLPACASLNLNVILALHHGIENIAETLATADWPADPRLNETRRERVNHSLELWLVLRQAENYCRAAKLPRPIKWLFIRSLAAAMQRR
jgi:hypothetical protein